MHQDLGVVQVLHAQRVESPVVLAGEALVRLPLHGHTS